MLRRSPILATRYPLLATGLRSYFTSGWAFLIPYLAVYLLYYLTKWPVNASRLMENGEVGMQNGWAPAMLHVYWALHAIHVVLAGLALWSWVKERRGRSQEPGARSQETNTAGAHPDPSDPIPDAEAPDHRLQAGSTKGTSDSPGTSPASRLLQSTAPLPPTSDLRPLGSGLRLLNPDSWLLAPLQRLLPWALLALLFYIPGVYLEWPSDPWEHLRRINEWRILDTVGAHSSWHKSAYFIPYSMLSWCTGLRQLFWLDFYYTGICLLLCWQYYKLARACGLGERASMVFVILQALLFGNNIFSFYRYYGISSSIYAQLGAIALTRIFLEWAARGTKLDPLLQELTDGARQCVDGEPRGLRQAARPERSGGLEERVPTGRDDNKPEKPGYEPNTVLQKATETNIHHGDTGTQRIPSNLTARILNWFSPYLCASVVQPTPGEATLQKVPQGTKLDHGDTAAQRNASLSSVKTDQPITGSEFLTTDHTDRHGLRAKPQQDSDTPLAPDCHRPFLVRLRTLLTPGSCLLSPPKSAFWHLPTILSLLTSGSCLLLFTAFNHPQGLGIAGLGIAAVIVWRLIEWKRSALWWLIGGTIVINALFLALYHRPAIIETYRAHGYLNAWYGFNILDLASPAGDRMLQIVSAFGLVNLAATLFLIRRNDVISWLTIMPFLTLLLPCLAIPFAILANRTSGELNIVTFQRLLFAFPIGLAFVLLGTRSKDGATAGLIVEKRQPYGIPLISIVYFVLTGLIAAPLSNSYNRVWHTTAVVPEDLQLHDIFSRYEALKLQLFHNPELRIVTIKAGTALQTYSSSTLIGAEQCRTIGGSSIESTSVVLDFLRLDEKSDAPQPKSHSEIVLQSNISKRLIADPKSDNPAAWVTLGSGPPEFANSIVSPTVPFSAVIQNPSGSKCNPFTSALIPVQKTKSYHLEMSVKQIHKTNATVYLTVAWLDAQGNLLVSNIDKPLGSGRPRGWINGTYSYFGLVDQTVPTFWSKFGISFGLGEYAAVPSNAHFIRVGALLNYNNTPSAVIQIAGVRLFEIPPPVIGIAVPSTTSVYSPKSYSGLLSMHWPAQQAIADRGGTKDILKAAEIMRAYNDQSPQN